MKSGKCDICEAERHPDNLVSITLDWRSAGVTESCYTCKEKYQGMYYNLRNQALENIDKQVKEQIRKDASLPPELLKPKKKFFFFRLTA